MTAAVQLLYMGSERAQRGYRDVADGIERAIAAGELKARERLPTVAELARREGVALKTAVRAMRVLKERGLIVTKPGGGSWVADRPSRADELAELRELRARVDRLERELPQRIKAPVGGEEK